MSEVNVETGTEIPGEQSEGSLAPEIHEQVQEKAKQKGWAPIDSWRGDPEDWVDAKEFLGREKLYNKIHSLERAIEVNKNATQKDFQEIAKYFAQMKEVEYKRALNDLRAQRREALQEGDMDKADQLDAQLDEIKDQRAAAANQPKPATASTPDPIFESWREENKWFDNDKELQQEAVGIGVGYSNAHPNATQAEVLRYVAERVKKFNPDKFGEPKETFNSVESPTRASGTSVRSQKGKLSVNDLNETERSVMKTLVRSGALKLVAEQNKRSQEAEYLAQLAAAKGLQ